MLLSLLFKSIPGSYSPNTYFPHKSPNGSSFFNVYTFHGWFHSVPWLPLLALNLWFPNNHQPKIFSRASHLHIQLLTDYVHFNVREEPKCDPSKTELTVIPINSVSLLLYISVISVTPEADIVGCLPKIHPCPFLLPTKTPILFIFPPSSKTLELYPWYVLVG